MLGLSRVVTEVDEVNIGIWATAGVAICLAHDSPFFFAVNVLDPDRVNELVK